MDFSEFMPILYAIGGFIGVIFTIMMINFFANYYDIKLNDYGIYVLWILACTVFFVLLPKKKNIFRVK